MGMRDCSRRSLLFFLRLCDNAVWCINSAMSSMPFPIESAKRSPLNSQGSLNWRRKKTHCSIWLRALAKYQKRYPEAIRSLCEDEEHLLTFYAFPPVMHRYIRTTNAIESFFSNVRQRTDQIDAFTTETSCLTIVWAVMQDIRLPRIPVN